MNRAQDPLPHSSQSPELANRENSIREIARFLCVVRARKEIVLMALVVSGLLGALYYATAPRIFSSNASLLVIQPGGQTLTTEISGDRIARDLMPTYTELLSSEGVCKEALKSLAPEHRGDLAGVPRSEWPDLLGNKLSTRARRGTNILDLSYQSRDPETAAAVVDAVLTAYVDSLNGLHKDASREILNSLMQEKRVLEQKLDTKQQELLTVRRNVGELAITEGDEGVNVVMRRAIERNLSLIEANGKRIEAESGLRTLEDAIANGGDLQQYIFSMDENVGHEAMLRQFGWSSNDAQMLSHINNQLISDKAELNSLLRIYGRRNQKVLEAESRIDVAEQYLQNRQVLQSTQYRKITSEQLKPMLLKTARQKLEMASRYEEKVHASYEAEKHHALALDHSATVLKMTQGDWDRLRADYEMILKRITNIDSGQEIGALRTSVLTEPKVPLHPVSPRLRIVGLMSLLFGVMVGLGVVYLQDLLDDRFRSPEDLQEQTGVPILAMIRKLEPLEEGIGVDNIHVHVRQTGSDAESFRTLRTALAFANGGVQRLIISSTEPGDGKTTVTVNLAAAVAQSGHKTLLIDADMRRPGTTPLLDLRGQSGLSMILRDTAPVAESAQANIHASMIENLDVIPSGLRPVNPMELLGSNRFADLLAWAEVEYEQIIIDSPPALAVSDAAIIGRLVDGVILIVRPEKNRRRMVVRAVESFPSLGVNVLGTVINQVDSEKSSDYYGYGYGYSYSYGHDDAGEAPSNDEQPGLLPQRVERTAA